MKVDNPTIDVTFSDPAEYGNGPHSEIMYQVYNMFHLHFASIKIIINFHRPENRKMEHEMLHLIPH